ncbi:seripauperin pau11 [Saccharomyces pastorianus]|uniref:Seripauperin pau11 n=1 Tax=Saccharomyces pastorianus TaxID=27292 RepID=A0A6C1E4B2_SACPS|nr:seripauperin pau11 [Saccharomyces pastorianus]
MVKLTSIAAGSSLGPILHVPSRPTETYPVEVAEAVFNYGDFTTMLTGIAPDQVTRMITGVPWYSSRLKPAISSALSKDGIYTIAN